MNVSQHRTDDFGTITEVENYNGFGNIFSAEQTTHPIMKEIKLAKQKSNKHGI